MNPNLTVTCLPLACMATRGQNLEAEATTEEVDWSMRTGKDIEQVERRRAREEERSPFCLGLNNNGERCQRARQKPFCSDHLWQWNALSDETKFAINDLAELPQNAFNHELWDTQHEKLHTFITDLCTEQAADAVQSAALAWNADQKQFQGFKPSLQGEGLLLLQGVNSCDVYYSAVTLRESLTTGVTPRLCRKLLQECWRSGWRREC